MRRSLYLVVLVSVSFLSSVHADSEYVYERQVRTQQECMDAGVTNEFMHKCMFEKEILTELPEVVVTAPRLVGPADERPENVAGGGMGGEQLLTKPMLFRMLQRRLRHLLIQQLA